MACYHPLIRIEDLTVWNKGADGHKYHPAKIIKQESLNDLEILKKYSGSMHYKTTIIPCGKCIGCRLDYSQDWANRTYLESQLYKENYFVTLTYDDEHLIVKDEITDKDGFTWLNEDQNATLSTEDFERFLNTFRQIMKRDYKVDGIRFIGCGEYGEESQRPHYHFILLNCPLPSETFFEPRIKNGNTYFRNTIIERAWTKGISNICPANWETMAYTARYITKKINGEGSEQLYAANGLIKEFFRQSRMPGIGKPYYDLHKDEIYKNDYILVKTKKGTAYRTPPKYFDDLYEEEEPEKFKEIKWKREQKAEYGKRLKSQETSLFLRDQLQVEERSKEQQGKMLKRGLK